jgi:rubrerythrin
MAKEHDKTLGVLRTAIQMEIDGKEYYLKASKASGNELGKKLLEKLAAEEDIHREVFEGIYRHISEEKGWPEEKFKGDGGRGLRTIFAKAINSMDTDLKTMPTEIDAVETAMAMENKTYDFYKSRIGKAAYGAEKKFYEELAIQEKEHHRVLLDYYEFLKNPAAWFVEKEHPSLDGG